MDSNEIARNSDVPLSLISQLCDSRLKELSTVKPFNNSSLNSEKFSCHNTLYSDVLGRPSCNSLQGSSSSISSKSYGTDLWDPESQHLQIPRKIPLSKHIKSVSIAEFMNLEDANAHLTENEISLFNNDANINLNISNVKAQLEIYFPALKRQVKNSTWAYLESLPSLQIISNSVKPSGCEYVISCDNSKPNQTNSSFVNGQTYKWDPEQGFLFSSTDEKMVFYGIVDKPGSIKHQRLKKLFDHVGVASLPLQSMTTRKKRLYLQDATARIELRDLSGKLKYGETVFGIAVAVIGRVSGTILHVEDVLFPTPCNPEWPISKDHNIEMVFVSGLHLGSNEGHKICLDLLQDYILGLSGSAYEQKDIVSSRVRLFLVGNLTSKTVSGKAPDLESITTSCTRNAEKLDDFLEPLVRIMEVFVIPGENDLTFSSALPQPPLHPKLLAESSRYRTLKRLTNPARIQVSISNSSQSSQQSSSSESCSMMDNSISDLLKDDIDFIDLVLQSGKNVKHTMEYCDISCPVEMGKRLLQWGHLHPTCDNDSPLAQNIFSVKGSLPHVMVIGGLSEFKVVEWNGTKIIGVPSFQKTHTAVVLTKDFDVIPLCFKLA